MGGFIKNSYSYDDWKQDKANKDAVFNKESATEVMCGKCGERYFTPTDYFVKNKQCRKCKQGTVKATGETADFAACDPPLSENSLTANFSNGTMFFDGTIL